MGSPKGSVLAQALGDALAERLARDGWQRVARSPRPPVIIGEFTRALHNGFAAVAALDWRGPAEVETADRTLGMSECVEETRGLDPEAVWLEIALSVGVHFEPLTQLSQAIDGWVPIDLLKEDIEDLDPSQAVVRVESALDTPAAVEQLAGMIVAYAVPFAERHASVELVIEARADRDRYEPLKAAELKAALLTAAHRWEQAERALTELDALRNDSDLEEDRRIRRVAWQLRRFIDAEGELAVPESPPSWSPSGTRLSRSEHHSFSELWASAWSEAKAQREALAVVRAAAAGKSHDELKAMLEQEQRSRGLDLDPDALKLASQAGQIEAEREQTDKATTLVGGLRELVEGGRDIAGIIKRVRRHEPEHPPRWMRAPDRAAYPVRTIGEKRWIEVKLDPGTEDWLARVAAHSTKVGRIHKVEVWLEPQESLVGQDAQLLVVHVGERRVGVLGAKAVEAYRPAIAAAAERDELPWTEARLGLIAGPHRYVLALPLPTIPNH